MKLFSSLNRTTFSTGQVWSYRTRPGEEYSTLIINQIDQNSLYGTIFHIGITGIRIKDPMIPGGIVYQLPHVPVSKQTFEKSVITLIKQSHPDNTFITGYQIWREAFQYGRAGVFLVSIAELLSLIENAINQ